MKIEAKQINEWAERAYNNAVKHGWHEKEKSNAHWMMMVCTEVAEAVQSDRKGRRMNELDKEGLKSVLAKGNESDSFFRYYSDAVENKVESGFADICIRIFDFMGVRGIVMEHELVTNGYEVSCMKNEDFTETAMRVIWNICACSRSIPKSNIFCIMCKDLLELVFGWAEAQNIDIVEHINIKMRYNEGREYKHGNKLY